MNNSSFVRWQSISMQQLGFTSNLLFTVNIAVIGFIVNKLADNDFEIISSAKALFTIGLFILIFCFILGIVINLTRLYDFRLTARTARLKEKQESQSLIDDYRRKTKCLGDATWIIFKIQIFSFLLGLSSLTISFIIMFSEKLF